MAVPARGSRPAGYRVAALAVGRVERPGSGELCACSTGELGGQDFSGEKERFMPGKEPFDD